VVYQQDPLDFSFARQARPGFVPRPSQLPEEVRRESNPYGFVGRDGPILALERALRRPPAGILISGLGGVGKTTLARGFIQWLDATDGLGEGCFWFTFADIRTAEFVFNRMGETLFGPQFIPLDLDKKVEALAAAFREHKFLIVWDNLESVRGIPGTAVAPNLSEADQRLLTRFLDRLRGAPTKVLITSRSPEDWLGNQRRFLLPLGGLEGEERWDYCTAILRDLGLRIDRNAPDLVKLMDLLAGHPLAMRVMLPRLAERPAAWLVEVLRSRLSDLDPDDDEAQARLYATLRFAQESLPADVQPLLIPLALHEGFMVAEYLEVMAQQVDARWTRARIDDLAEALVAAGLLHDHGQATFQMHPVLTGFLRSALLPTAADIARDTWTRAFVDVMGRVADDLAPRPLHEQRGGFHYNGANFHHALGEAERLGIHVGFASLIQALAAYAQNISNLEAADGLFERLASHHRTQGNQQGEAAALHHLGMIAAERRDFAAAEQWYRRSLAIKEKQGNEHIAASTYHHLGIIAAERRDFTAAEQWYRRSLATSEKQGDEHGSAITYHQLGRIAEK
ncbi:MAG TPA: tetratricopeptide repeat protein, partial [Isosphaeraceae bacterium]